jgi:hypothetical protein
MAISMIGVFVGDVARLIGVVAVSSNIFGVFILGVVFGLSAVATPDTTSGEPVMLTVVEGLQADVSPKNRVTKTNRFMRFRCVSMSI